MSLKEKQAAAKQTFVFSAPLASEYPAKQDVECVARFREPDAEQVSWHYGQNILRNITCEQDVECVARIREPAYSPNRMK